jgi:large subunit ribosomal protein L4
MTATEAIAVPVLGLNGSETGTVALNPKVFGVAWQPTLVAQAVRVQQANKRQPIAHTKTRADVRGGGKKPWRQKGTGRARHGSIRSPIWVGGGVTFGPRNTRNYSLKINIKAKRKALCMALSAKRSDGSLTVVESFDLQPMKTKSLQAFLKALKIERGAVLVPAAHNVELRRVSRNLTTSEILRADSLNVIDVMKARRLIVAKDSLAVIDKLYQPRTA